MKVLVCGSRDWEDRNAIGNRISALWREHGDEVTVIHGGAKGADQIANSFARMFGLQRRVFRPDYEQFGKGWAPKARNLLMLEQEPELVIAFQRNGSNGTQHTIDEARKRGIPVEVHTA
jgi:hypothetical protein